MYCNANLIESDGIVPTPGETYIVTWDGTEYLCEAYQVNEDSCALGDPSFNRQPFYIYFGYDNNDINVATSEDSETHTFKIEETEHGRLGADYLPVVYNGATELTLIEALNAISDAVNAGLYFSAEPGSNVQ